ncbi:hypothetical protein CSK29544_02698 [Cronobacter sakazakii]|nr:hypothetical protein CSK29544_02698 [Cronobacter sakazakii]
MQPGDRSESGPLRPAGAFSATDAITKSDRDHVMKKNNNIVFFSQPAPVLSGVYSR